MAIACVLYAGLTVRQMRTHGYPLGQAFRDVIEHDFGSPFGVLSQASVVYAIIGDRDESAERRDDFHFGAHRDALTERETYVMVVGETARADRWSVTGYERDTSPGLSRESNLVAFRDVITPWTVTQKSVPLMLTRATVDDFDVALEERSIISAYHESGFTTFWLTSQAFDQFAGYIHLLAGDADHLAYHSRVFDRELLDTIDEIFAEEDGDLFIVLHTMGSHIEYANRYPPEFRRFPVSGDRPYREILNNEFDNSILYTDTFLTELIGRLRGRTGVSALLYCSDHGENLMDDERNLVGHNYTNQYDTQIPLFFWYSNEYARVFPEKVANAASHSSDPLSTENVFHSLADMGGVRFQGLDLELSIFQSSLRAMPRRVVTTTGEIVDYDADIAPASRSSAANRPEDHDLSGHP
jgi:glucan phosphoethanolaminetransferase (alkaline phosphatase superfamily)